MSEASEVALPASLPFPVTITKLLVQAGDAITRSTPLLYYSFKYKVPGEDTTETRYGTWESHLGGTVELWSVDPGDVIQKDYGPVLLVDEPCKHGLQIAGLCANCGKDMTHVDYMSVTDTSRATLQMDHGGGGPLLSAEEASRIEQQTSEYLLSRRKLTLIVDLDQTILHTTMDRTVGEWLADKKRAARSPKGEKEEVNPNWAALEDVASFQLADDQHGAAAIRPESPFYYVKPRPRLTKFMDKISELYEMHVYTMGTRCYANAICKALDPSGKWFGERVLTRNESGSERLKSLKRLFPSDQSMVVIIDDRADIWNWSPHLVKVVPYEFFVGTGDINSATLPKQKSSVPTVPAVVPPESEPEPPTSTSVTPSQGPSEQVEALSPTAAEEKLREEEQNMKRLKVLEVEELLEGHPLAKAQEELDVQAEVEERQDSEVEDKQKSTTPPGTPPLLKPTTLPPDCNGKSEEKEATRTPTPKAESLQHRIHRAILHNNDNELERVQRILEEVHSSFFSAFDPRSRATAASKLKGKIKAVGVDEPDVSVIIPRRMRKTFEGCHFAFSSIIPLNEKPERHDIWKTAIAFGAVCHKDVSRQVTHLVTAKLGTQKIDAARRGGIPVVSVKWFSDSVARWEKMDVKAYLLAEENREKDRRSDTSKPSEDGSSADKPVVILNDDEVAPLKEPIQSGGSIFAPPAPTAPVDVGEKDIEEDEDMVIGDVELEEFDWAAADAEVDSVMAEDEGEDEDEDDAMDSTNERSEQTVEPTSSPSAPHGLKRKRSSSAIRSISPSPASPPVSGRIPDPDTPQTKRLKTMHERLSSGLREVVNAPFVEPALSSEYEERYSQQTVSSVMTESGHTGVPTTQESVDTMSGSSQDTTEDEDEEEDFLADAFAKDAKGEGEGDEESESDDSDSDSSEESNG